MIPSVTIELIDGKYRVSFRFDELEVAEVYCDSEDNVKRYANNFMEDNGYEFG